MKEIIIKGTQSFSGKEIPVIYGGFGENQKCICDKTIAQIHGMREPDIRRRIADSIARFKENIDFIDLKQRVHEAHTLINSINLNDININSKSCASDAQQLLQDLGYTQMQISKAEHIYILSERGYAKLIKIMDTDLAWEIHDALMDEYFRLREEKEATIEKLLLTPDFGIQVLTRLKEEREQRKQLELEKHSLQVKIEEDTPKVLFADSVSASKSLILIRDLAKLLKQNGLDTGEKRLYEWLRQNKYLISCKGMDYNMPTQKSMNLGLFEIKESITYVNAEDIKIRKTTKVTGKGQQYFIDKLIKPKKEIEFLVN